MQIEAINKQFIALLCHAHPDQAAELIVASTPDDPPDDYIVGGRAGDGSSAFRISSFGVLEPHLIRIVECVSEFYGVSVREMASQRKKAEVVRARHVAMYLARELTSLSYPQIGRPFGGRDHTTIMHACNKVGGLIYRDDALLREISDLTKIIMKAK